MRKTIFLFFIFVTAVLGGCATKAVQTEQLLSDTSPYPRSFLISDVDFIDQSAGYCGPATLTMAMRWAGENVTVEDVAKQVYTPGFKGSLQSDLVGASRRQGLMAVQIEGLPALMKEISSGNPVIIFENLGLSWAPTWHYAVVLGYDLEKQEMIMHSGHDAYYHWDMRHFERSWMLGDYWGLVVLPAGKLSKSAGEMPHATAAVGLEQSGEIAAAKKSYQAILKKWPNNLVALLGLGNIAYEQGNRTQAIDWIEKAVKNHPDSLAAKHNLAVAKSR